MECPMSVFADPWFWGLMLTIAFFCFFYCNCCKRPRGVWPRACTQEMFRCCGCLLSWKPPKLEAVPAAPPPAQQCPPCPQPQYPPMPPGLPWPPPQGWVPVVQQGRVLQDQKGQVPYDEI